MVTGGRAKLEKSSEGRRALRLLDRAGVQVDNLAHLEESFAVERIEIRPARLSLGDVPGPGRWIVPVEMEAGPRKNPVRVRVRHFWNEPGAPPVSVENEW